MTIRWLLAALLALSAAACGERDTQPSAAALAGGFPALYEIIGSDGALEGWLFGTIHSLPNDVVWRSPRFDDVVDDADFLIVEVANLADKAVLTQTFTSMAFDSAPPVPIRQRVSADMRVALDRLFYDGGISQSHYDAMESWAAALAISQLASQGKPENGADRALISDFARRRVVELEGVQAQLAIFDGLPEAEQRDLLESVVMEASRRAEQADELAVSWKSGDLEALEEESARGILADPELRESLLTERNRSWAEALATRLSASERPLIAVGAGHLLGKDGLPALLEDRGYRVRRIQ